MSTDPQDPYTNPGTPQQPQDGEGTQPPPGAQAPGSQPPPTPNDPNTRNPYENRPGSPYLPGTPSRQMTPTEERNFGLFAHLASGIALVLSSGTLGWAAALVFYLVYQDRGPFVRQHAANALNVQIIVGIVLLISVPLAFVGIGFITGFLAFAFGVIVHIMGAIKANNGEWWTPPMTPKFVK